MRQGADFEQAAVRWVQGCAHAQGGGAPREYAVRLPFQKLNLASRRMAQWMTAHGAGQVR